MFTHLQHARQVSKSSGKGVMSQIAEIIGLRFFHTGLGPSEYYLYRLYDDKLHNYKTKKQFVGWRHSINLDRRMNSDQWRIFANDKVAFYSMMEANSIEYPKVAALFDRSGRRLKNAVPLHSIDAAAAYLRDPAIYPLFIKPVSGTYGRGAFSAMKYDAETDTVCMGSGEYLPISEILKMFELSWTRGYLMQHLLRPHPDVVKVVGPRLSSLRVIVLLTESAPKVFRAVWKLPVGKNMSDNFMHGETGNLIANVDLGTGTVKHAVTGRGNDIRIIEHHPDTKVSLAGQAVPMWDEVVRYVTSGASLFPGLKMQHWDVALCPEGPIGLEINVEGSMDLHQIAGSKGIEDDDLLQVLADYAPA